MLFTQPFSMRKVCLYGNRDLCERAGKPPWDNSLSKTKLIWLNVGGSKIRAGYYLTLGKVAGNIGAQPNVTPTIAIIDIERKRFVCLGPWPRMKNLHGKERWAFTHSRAWFCVSHISRKGHIFYFFECFYLYCRRHSSAFSSQVETFEPVQNPADETGIFRRFHSEISKRPDAVNCSYACMCNIARSYRRCYEKSPAALLRPPRRLGSIQAADACSIRVAQASLTRNIFSILSQLVEGAERLNGFSVKLEVRGDLAFQPAGHGLGGS